MPVSPAWWWADKGAYVPRADLGGEAALKDGIAAVHEQGEHIFVYVEGFIIDKESTVGQEHGAEWSKNNVAAAPRHVAFPMAPGTWTDGVSGEAFIARGGVLAVPVPAHGIRLLHEGQAADG